MKSLILPDWSLPKTVKAYSTYRYGGISRPPYDSLNLGTHVGDDVEAVKYNRTVLMERAELPHAPVWLEQVHSTRVLIMDEQAEQDLRADAAYSNQSGVVCAVMTADCLPVLFASTKGDEVAAAHAGWRGLCQGILENTIACFTAKPSELTVWLGPAIGPQQFEVGEEVRDAFIATDPSASNAFLPHHDGKFFANIYLLARQRLQREGIAVVSGGDRCTFTEKEHFFSYRRDTSTGRMASLIWVI